MTDLQLKAIGLVREHQPVGAVTLYSLLGEPAEWSEWMAPLFTDGVLNWDQKDAVKIVIGKRCEEDPE